MLTRLLSIVARLPLGALYGLAAVGAGIMHSVVRYRRKVVSENLKACFPEMDSRRRKAIERKFYRRMADSAVETIKLLHISDTEMARRMEFENAELIDRHLAAGRSVAVYFAHTFNWEWTPSVTLHLAHAPGPTVYAQIYRPLRSQTFDSLMLHLRGRFHSECIAKETSLRRLLAIRREGRLSVTGFMSDQHPSHGDPGHLTTLLGHPTLMITGTETLARKMGMAAVYWDMSSPRRGHYKITVRPMADDASRTEPGQLTEMYTRLLEHTIRRDPSLWLWSHKRWKYAIDPARLENLKSKRQ